MTVFTVLLPGCAYRMDRACVPKPVSNGGELIDLHAPPGSDRPVDSEVFRAVTNPLQNSNAPLPEGKKQNVLALSGGGMFGAYSVGVLNGWTTTGQRPSFDVVTGVSTGAIIGTFALLGTEYDNRLCHLYTTINSEDIYRDRPKLSILWSDSTSSSKPLERMLEKEIDDQIIQSVAVAHSQGKRFYVATTNLDTRRLVIWDMGAIASSGRPDAAKLYRKIILASAAVPGFFPPVKIDVTINGRVYSEMHVDGGAADQVFVRASLLNVDEDRLKAGQKPLVGTNVYVIVAGKIYADPECTKSKIKDIAASSLISLVYSSARNEIDKIYTLSLLTGMKFHLAALPQEFATKSDSLDFDRDEMRRLYAEGYRLATCGQAWQATPPAADPAEQSTPRRGTDFLAPVQSVEIPIRR
ncbi:patatin-like phospholipase family protein [Telmatocola sphagniphila]|uniref:Patatin-like phospholipase family protein n=1 Tax=Telmatocola sphagniphila TaxID=1123043 RepID=A0A8E6B3F2_9BACT|nr:patatin-like phospholipase family protein [Telmatocola sphagniphila]QVL30617.1 patatin-like phospholipase family protein [Telmatocola sphagniphila]